MHSSLERAPLSIGTALQAPCKVACRLLEWHASTVVGSALIWVCLGFAPRLHVSTVVPACLA